LGFGPRSSLGFFLTPMSQAESPMRMKAAFMRSVRSSASLRSRRARSMRMLALTSR
jgi:hypothetical protein